MIDQPQEEYPVVDEPWSPELGDFVRFTPAPECPHHDESERKMGGAIGVVSHDLRRYVDPDGRTLHHGFQWRHDDQDTHQRITRVILSGHWWGVYFPWAASVVNERGMTVNATIACAAELEFIPDDRIEDAVAAMQSPAVDEMSDRLIKSLTTSVHATPVQNAYPEEE